MVVGGVMQVVIGVAVVFSAAVEGEAVGVGVVAVHDRPVADRDDGDDEHDDERPEGVGSELVVGYVVDELGDQGGQNCVSAHVGGSELLEIFVHAVFLAEEDGVGEVAVGGGEVPDGEAGTDGQLEAEAIPALKIGLVALFEVGVVGSEIGVPVGHGVLVPGVAIGHEAELGVEAVVRSDLVHSLALLGGGRILRDGLGNEGSGRRDDQEKERKEKNVHDVDFDW